MNRIGVRSDWEGRMEINWRRTHTQFNGNKFGHAHRFWSLCKWVTLLISVTKAKLKKSESKSESNWGKEKGATVRRSVLIYSGKYENRRVWEWVNSCGDGEWMRARERGMAFAFILIKHFVPNKFVCTVVFRAPCEELLAYTCVCLNFHLSFRYFQAYSWINIRIVLR